LLRTRAGHDFSEYKEGTIARRLDRRMKMLQIESVEKYVEMLEGRPEEADQLFKDLLIGVTQSFRDAEAFEALGQQVIPTLLAGKTGDQPVRACVVGCASGEEAYSLAILLCEHAATQDDAPKTQIFATDIDERTLEMARKGRYPESIAEHVSAERLERFFTKHDNAYQVKRELRERVIFSTHSFIRDPPFSRLDLISCRNVMIYLGRELQERVVPLFHYALRPGGYLFLGSSESVTSHRDLFQTVDKKHRIFQSKERVPRPQVRFPFTSAKAPKQAVPKAPETEERQLLHQLDRVVSERYGPACVVVRENGDAVYFSARIGRYLQPPAGGPNSNALNMAAEGLRSPMRACLLQAVSTRERAVQKQIRIQTNGVSGHVDLTVDPLTVSKAELFMIMIEQAAAAPLVGDLGAFDADAEGAIRNLEHQLRTAEEQARAAYEELETSNEELQSANEEFQSTNEELETSKEELQSFNEELETVNAELGRKVVELDQANSDLQNFFDSTQIATLFLDSELRIKKFTPAAASLFRLLGSDTGRPVTDLAAQFSDDDLVDDIREVTLTLTPRERHVAGKGGRHYQMRVLPYRTVRNVIDGVVITFTDVTALKEAELRAQEEKTAAQNIVDTVREPMLVLDAGLRVKSANNSFYQTFQLGAESTLNKTLYELDSRRWDLPELRRLVDELLPKNKTVEDFEVDYDGGNVGRKTLLVNARQIDHVQLILLAIEDVTERKQAVSNLRRLNEDLRHFSYAASHDLQEPLRMVMSYTQLLSREFKDKLGPAANQFIAYAVQGAQRMEMLLRDLREFWSVNEVALNQTVRVDCEQVLRKVLDLLAAPIHEAGATVTHDPMPCVFAEETPLVLVFQNLVSNAIKYRRKDVPLSIHVSADADVNVCTVSVRDNGLGIEAEHLDAVFAPFKRLHSAEIPGSGLGLAICRRVVERYGGRIWVESEYGLGSTFRFTLPKEAETM
jgi:two-component system CheB/CheR fusion protein